MALTEAGAGSLRPEQGQGYGAARIVGETSRTTAETRDTNDSTSKPETASFAALDAKDADKYATLTNPVAPPTAPAVIEAPPAPTSRNRLFGWPSTRVGRIATILTLAATGSTAVVAGAVALSDRRPAVVARPFAGSHPTGEASISPEASTEHKDISEMTEAEAAKLSLPDIRRMVTERGWAGFTLMPGYTLDLKKEDPVARFYDYHLSLTGSTLYSSQEELKQKTARGECPDLHLLAHGMDPLWYLARCARITAHGDVPLPDDYEVAVKGSPKNKIIPLKNSGDGFLAVVETTNAKSVFQQDVAYLWTFETGSPPSQPGSKGYFTLRIGPQVFAELSKTA